MATASNDVLESFLMVTPYAWASRKSKLLGRAITGAAVGGSIGYASGFGSPGMVIGGAGGALIGSIPGVNRLGRKMSERAAKIGDKVLPTLEKKVRANIILKSAAAFGTTSLAEAAEEGVQYLNSLDAEKILSEADDDINLRSFSNLFVNDLKKRGQVFKAVASQFGLFDSPY